MKTERSQQLFAEAQQIIPGGVNSPVRAFRSVGGQPRFITRAKGSRLYDVDGNSYIDYVFSWGPMILGHAAPSVIKCDPKGRREWNELRRADRAGNSARPHDPRRLPFDGKSPARQFRHRSGHERDSGRAWPYETRQHSQSLKDAITATAIICWRRRFRFGHVGNSRFAWSPG